MSKIVVYIFYVPDMFQPIDLETFLTSYGVISIMACLTAILYILRPEMNTEHREVTTDGD